MVPGPPRSLHLFGATVLVISLMSNSSCVWVPRRLLTATFTPSDPPAPLAAVRAVPYSLPPAVPTDWPPLRLSGPVIGDGVAVGADSGGPLMRVPRDGAVGAWPTVPKFGTGMT